ncbi:endonuclease/exonuclease/phosphatase family protein [Henriciella pelagia]|uniref:Endonuclease n=1 Tax=Henriciella pelagia TaxID=1977912 RepID=A0ABQ1JU67_9PROT|nr:endonuclease/exonuclease/phosphatase family protein [Henriciella pelagia]GGB78079.1 endonuclease [Henriciella pelagia]
MKVLWIALILVALLVIYALAVRYVTLRDGSIPMDAVPASPQEAGSEETLSVMIWNLGYAGLGAESDFKADGGEMLQPPSRAVVEKNLAGIQDVLRAQDADVFLFQELARGGFLNRGVDVVAGVREVLPGYGSFFTADIKTRLLPSPLSLRHGIGMFWRGAPLTVEIVRLPEEPEPIMGFIQRRYHVQVMEFEQGGVPWTLINVHLSAFDEGANTRLLQLLAVIDLAKRHYESGRAVAVGGDWNMRLTPTDFASTSDDSALFWIHDFPKHELPDGWQIAVDPSVPTVRTNERPYARDENYRTIIDGLLVSPNVEVVSAAGLDLDFQITDHQPVRYTLRARP